MTHQRVLAASLEVGIGALAAKLASPEPFILGAEVGAPGVPVGAYSAMMSIREGRLAVKSIDFEI